MSMELWNRSLQLLSEGNYDEGWPEHEWIRTGNPNHKDQFKQTHDFGLPIWKGEVEPITLLVNADFGMGDTIHFYRFIEEVKKRVSKVVLRCDEDFQFLFENVHAKQSYGIPGEKIIHMMALPKVLGIKDISGKPYLNPNAKYPPKKSLSVFDSLKFTKIGVCWSGNPFNPRDHERSIPAEEFLKIKHKLFSLNKIDKQPGIMDIGYFMNDWNDTAHLVQKLDLVITVDTAIAHLVGAMGKPVWLLVPKSPDWRWGKEGSKTVWYDSMRIFRQETTWSDLMEKVVSSLTNSE